MQHSDMEIASDPPPEDQFSETPSETDSIFNYHNARLQVGMLFMDIVDAIKEGDGYLTVISLSFYLQIRLSVLNMLMFFCCFLF